MFDLTKRGAYSAIFLLLVLAIFVGLILFIVFMEKSTRNIKIQYPNRGMMRANGISDDSSRIPIKMNMSGVIPPIFASSILMFPFAISKMFNGEIGQKISAMIARGNFIYVILFTMLIIFFCYFYSSVVFNTEDVANNLKKNNCFISGIRPGKATKEYLSYVVNRITFVGAIYLSVVCLLPEIIVTKYSLPISIGGTGLLIVINVVIDLIGQIQSYMFSNKYNTINKQRRIRVR